MSYIRGEAVLCEKPIVVGNFLIDVETFALRVTHVYQSGKYWYFALWWLVVVVVFLRVFVGVGVPGSFVHYSGVIDKNNKLEAVQIAAIRDSMLYTVKYEAFNLSYAAYRMAFDSTLATLSIPEPKVAQKDVDPSIPSTEYASFENNLLKLSYPDNFNTFLPMFKAPTVFSLVIKGYRQDSFIRLDVIPAKGLAPEKVVEQNVKFFKEISRSETMIDGQKTVYINYSPMKDINSRVYFLVKNDHFYRIIMNYYAPMNKDYLPAFEKAVASIVAK